MYIKDLDFQVTITHFAENHFCKTFFKKYKHKWLSTRQTIEFNLQRSYALFKETNLIDLIKYSSDENRGIFKLDFRIAGTNESPKSSGNRAVFTLCNKTGNIEVLLVYGKDHCKKKQSETQWLLEEIKTNFPEYKNLC
jgi:uncharacterized membrane-anchored protein